MNQQAIRAKIKLLSVPLLMILCLIVAVYYFGSQKMPLRPSESTLVNLPTATSASSLIREMHARHWLRAPFFWVLALRVTGKDARLKAGLYQRQPADSVWGFIQRVVDGDVLKQKFCIIEGTTQWQVKDSLNHALYIKDVNSEWFAAQNNAHHSLEGLLFADTYEYTAGSSTGNILQLAQTKLTKSLSEIWQKRDPSLPYRSSYELLIVASILEKETMWPAERRRISGVILNRLAANMPLQMDPTVHYALGHAGAKVLKHTDLSINSPFNTYKNRGLPPTPIAMVGMDSLVAAAHPEHTNYFYFVAKGDGTHQFSSDYTQHLRAIKQLRQHQ